MTAHDKGSLLPEDVTTLADWRWRERTPGSLPMKRSAGMRPTAGDGILITLLTLMLVTVIPQFVRAEDAEGLKLIGSDPLQGRPSYQPVTHFHNGKWFIYVGHMPGKALNPMTGAIEENGMSIVDVTDPAHAVFVSHVPPTDTSWYHGSAQRTGTYHVQVCDGSTLPHGKPGNVYVLRALGEIAHEILDVTDPLHPKRVNLVVRAEPSMIDNEEHTHKNYWDCSTGIAYLVASVAGWHAEQIFQIFDLSNPEKPQHIRDFGLPGSEPDEAGHPRDSKLLSPGAHTSDIYSSNSAHEARVVGDKLYAAYNPFNDGTMQILDLKKVLKGNPSVSQPLKPTEANLRYPQISRVNMPGYWGVHTAKAILGMKIPEYQQDKAGSTRDILVLLSEGASVGCDRARHVTFLLDITEPAYPVPISTYQADATSGNFCNRKIYFGPHNIQSQSAPMFDGKLLFITYFGAGLRVVDIRNPFKPIEVGHYIPSASANTHYEEYKGPWKGAAFEQAPLTNDVTVDTRGNIYIIDRADTGMHILALTGRAAQIAGE